MSIPNCSALGAASGCTGNAPCTRGSVPYRCTSLQNGQWSFDRATEPKAARNSLWQVGQVTSEKLLVSVSHKPSVCAARSKARSKLMRCGGWQMPT